MRNNALWASILSITITISYCGTPGWDGAKKTFCIQRITDAHPNQDINLALTFLLSGFRETGPCIQPRKIQYVKTILVEEFHIPPVINDIIVSYFHSPEKVKKKLSANEWYMFEEHIGKPAVITKEKDFTTPAVYKKHLQSGLISKATTFKAFIQVCLLDLQRLTKYGHADNPYQYRLEERALPPLCSYCTASIPVTPSSKCDLLLALPKDYAPDFIAIVHELSSKAITCKHCNNGTVQLYSKAFAQYPKLLMVITDISYRQDEYFHYIKSETHLVDEPFKLLGAFIVATEDTNRYARSGNPIYKKTPFVYLHHDEKDPCHIIRRFNHQSPYYDSNLHIQAALYRYTGK